MENHHDQQEDVVAGDDSTERPLESFLLIEENEIMQVESAREFAQKLGCSPETIVKVVSIFGTIGHGKSYTLNNTFFGCQKVFQTSSSQESCTIGVWAAYDAKRRVITLDTEGLLGVSANCQRRTRLLLKVLAISDIVIYRTKSERLEDNLFTFLGDASRVYVQHFFKEMQNAFQKSPELQGQSLSELGPVVIIFQETRDTEPLKQEANQTRESIIRGRFKTLGLTTEAFSAIEYVGIQTLVRPTNFDLLKQYIKRHIKSSSARTPRPLNVIYATLKLLNEKFNGDIEKTVPSMFNNTLLTCPVKCLSCNTRCVNSMNHHRDGINHYTESKCVYQHQFNNHLLYCRACHERGEEVVVTPRTCSSNDAPLVGLAKYAWAGYVLECSRCGVIHRSRQYWFGNKETWESTVRTEIKHVWPGELNKMQAQQNAAQRVLDSVSYLTEAVSSIGAKPTKMVSEWVADQIAPNYWIPNSRILHCALCNNEFGQFDQKHHCRLCGNGLCSTCSSRSKPVPERGWGETSVRVCDRCYERSDHLSAIISLPPLPVSLQQQQQQYNQQDENIEDDDTEELSQPLAPSNNVVTTSSTKKSNKSVGSATATTNNNNNNNNSANNGGNSKKQNGFNKKNKQGPSGSVTNSPSSKSIPIPKNRTQSGASSNNITPTQQSSSSSAESSSSCSNQSNNNHHTSVSDSPSTSRNASGSDSPVKTNGITTNGSCASGDPQPIDLLSGSPVAISNFSGLANHHRMNGEAMITARKLGEVLQSTLKTVVSTAIDYPLGVIKDSARPEYWTPDSEITNCGLCKTDFNEFVTIHHCRRCGGGFCHECSSKAMLVPERGWGDTRVRVCDKCYKTP